MNGCRRRLVPFLFVALAAPVACPLARAQRYLDSTGISVSGSAKVMVKPNRIEMDLSAIGSAELTTDAIVKYQDALRRTKEAFEKLELPSLKIKERGLAFSGMANNPRMMAMMMKRGMISDEDGPAAKPEVAIMSGLLLSLEDIDKNSKDETVGIVAKLIDAASDSGAMIGGGSSNYSSDEMGFQVRFVADKIDVARDRAYAKAFAAAKAQATRLAKLSGSKLGRVLNVSEESSGQSYSSNRRYAQMYGDEESDEDEDAANPSDDQENAKPRRLISPTLADLPLRIDLRVRFAIDE